MAHTEAQRNGFLGATGEYQLILEEVCSTDRTLSMELLNEMESRMGCLLSQGYHSMKTKKNPVLSPQEYYQGCMIMLLARLCEQAGRRPRPITDCLRDCLNTNEASKQLLLSLVLDRSHVGLKMEDWSQVLGLVSTIQATVASLNKRQGQRKKYLQGNKHQQVANKETISQDNLEALWVVPLSYIVGFVVYDIARRQWEGDFKVLSWEKHIRPTVETSLYAAFPRLGPAEYIDAGITLLQLDLLQHKYRNKVDELDTKHVAHKLKGNLLRVLLWTTGLPRYTLLARCAQVFLGRLDRDNTDDIVDACRKIFQQASPMEYISGLEEESSRAPSNGENFLLFTNGIGIAAEKCFQGDDSFTLGFPLLAHIDALLLEDNVEQAINIAVRMEHCLVLSEDDQLQAWARVVNYLFQTGQIFLDGFPVRRPEYLANRRFILEMIMTRSGPLGLAVFIEAYKHVLARVADLGGNVTEDEREYLQRACHQTVLRIFQAKHGEEEGIEEFKQSYLKHVEGIIGSSRIQLSSLLVSSSKKEQMNWAFHLLCQTNKVPDSLRLDDHNRPDLLQLFRRGESIPEHRLLATDGARTSAAVRNLNHAVVLDEGSPSAEMEAAMNYVDTNEQEMLQDHAHEEGTNADIEKEVEGEQFLEGQETLQDDVTNDGAEEDYAQRCAEEMPEHPAAFNYYPEEDHVSSSNEGDDEDVLCVDDSDREVITSALLHDKEVGGHESDQTTDEDCVQEQLGGTRQGYEQPYVHDKKNHKIEEKVDSDQQEDEVIDILDGDDEEEAEAEAEGKDITDGKNYEDKAEKAWRDGNHVNKAEVEVTRDGNKDGHEQLEVVRRDEFEVGSPGEMMEANANQSMDEVSQYEAGSQTGYEPEDTHGFTEEEVSEAMHTEDEEEERQEAEKGIQAPEESNEQIKKDTVYVEKPHTTIEPQTLSDMDAADEHTTGQEEDLGAESSEQDEGDGTDTPAYTIPKCDKTAEGPSLVAFAVRAQRQVDPDCSAVPTNDAGTCTTRAARPWHWSGKISPAADASTDPQWNTVGEESALPLPGSEADIQATTAAAEVFLDPKWDSTTELGTSCCTKPVPAKLGSPAIGNRQNSVRCASLADTSAARFGSVSFIDSPNYAATDEEMEQSSPQKVVVDCVPEVFEHSATESSKQLIAEDFAGKFDEPVLRLSSKNATGGLAQQDECTGNVKTVGNCEDKIDKTTIDKPNEAEMKPAAIRTCTSNPEENPDGITWIESEKSDVKHSAHDEEPRSLHVVKMDAVTATEEEAKEMKEPESKTDSESKESPPVELQEHVAQSGTTCNEEEKIDKLANKPSEVAARDPIQHGEKAKAVDAEVNDVGAETPTKHVMESRGVLEDKMEAVDEEVIDGLDDDKGESDAPGEKRPGQEGEKAEDSGKIEDSQEDPAVDKSCFHAKVAEETGEEAVIEVESPREKPRESKVEDRNEFKVKDTVQDKNAENDSDSEGVEMMDPAGEGGTDAKEQAEGGSADNVKGEEGGPSNEHVDGTQPQTEASVYGVVMEDPDTVKEEAADQEKVHIQQKPALQEDVGDKADDHEEYSQEKGDMGSNEEANDEGVWANESPLDANVALAELAAVADPVTARQIAMVQNGSKKAGLGQNTPGPGDTGLIAVQSISIPHDGLSPAISSVAASEDGSLRSPLYLPVATSHSSGGRDAEKDQEEEASQTINRKSNRNWQSSKTEELPKTRSLQNRAKKQNSASAKMAKLLNEEASDEESVAVAVMADEDGKTREVEPDSDGGSSVSKSSKGGHGRTKDTTLPTTIGKGRKGLDLESDMEAGDGDESDAVDVVEDTKGTMKKSSRISGRARRARPSSPATSVSSKTSQRSTRAACTQKAEGALNVECKSRRSTRTRKVASKAKAIVRTPRLTRRGSKIEESKEVKEEDESSVGSQGTCHSGRGTTNKLSTLLAKDDDQSIASSVRLTRGSKRRAAAADTEADNQSAASSFRLMRGSKRREGEEVKEPQQEKEDYGNSSSRSTARKAAREKKQKLAIEDDLAPIPEEEALVAPALQATAKRRTTKRRMEPAKEHDGVAESDEEKASAERVSTKHATGAKKRKLDEESGVDHAVEEVKPRPKHATRSRRRGETTGDEESVAAPRRTGRGKKGTSAGDEESFASAEEEGKSSAKGKATVKKVIRSNRGAKTRTANVEVSVAESTNAKVSIASSRVRGARGSKRSAQAAKEDQLVAQKEVPNKRATRGNGKGKARCAKVGALSEDDKEESTEEEKTNGKIMGEDTDRGKKAAVESTEEDEEEKPEAKTDYKISCWRSKAAEGSDEDEQPIANGLKKTRHPGKKKGHSTDEDEVSVAESTASSVRRSGRARKPRYSYKV